MCCERVSRLSWWEQLADIGWLFVYQSREVKHTNVPVNVIKDQRISLFSLRAIETKRVRAPIPINANDKQINKFLKIYARKSLGQRREVPSRQRLHFTVRHTHTNECFALWGRLSAKYIKYITLPLINYLMNLLLNFFFLFLIIKLQNNIVIIIILIFS